MRTKWLFAVVLLGLASLLLVGRASAQTNSYDSLRALILSDSDLSSTGLTTVNDSQSSLDGGVIEVQRLFGMTTSSGPVVVLIQLLGDTDGTPPPASVTNAVNSGDLLKAAAQGAGASVDSLTLQGSQGIGDTDQSMQASGAINGSPYQFLGDTFVNGNLIGLVFYAAPQGAVDSNLFSNLLSMQDDKLP